MPHDEEIRRRAEEISRTRLRKARPEDWPPGVRSIAMDEVDALGVDADGALYWDGKSIAITRIELRYSSMKNGRDRPGHFYIF